MNTFHKEERLCSKKSIEELFAAKKSFLAHPFRVLWMETPVSGQYPVQVAFGVSKRYDKRAVKRNLIRRRMREAYRKNKSLLYDHCRETSMGYHLFISYIAKEETEYALIEKKMISLFEKLKKIHE